jgi:hypothetical protein
MSALDGFDMPQPINRIVPNARVILDTDVLSEKPDIAVLVVRVFAIWAAIERHLNVLLVRLLGADSVPALAMFSILQTQALQTKALDAAAKSTLSPEDLDIFSASLAVANSVQKTRNRLAHWAWGKCTERPDLLVLGDPEGLKERDTRVAAHYQSLKPGAPNLLETYNIVRFDLSKFYGYTKTDLEREVRDLLEADEIVFLYGIHLDPSFSMAHAKAFDEPESHDEIRAQVLQQLNGKRLFREALAQIRASRQSKPPQGRNHEGLSGRNNLIRFGRTDPRFGGGICLAHGPKVITVLEEHG